MARPAIFGSDRGEHLVGELACRWSPLVMITAPWPRAVNATNSARKALIGAAVLELEIPSPRRSL